MRKRRRRATRKRARPRASSVAIEFDCPAGAIKQVTVTKRHQKELIPVKGVFVLDFSIKMKLRHWWNHDAGGVKYRKHSQDYLECVTA